MNFVILFIKCWLSIYYIVMWYMFLIGNCLFKFIILMLKNFKKEVNIWFEYYVWCFIKIVKFLENIVGKNGFYLINRI